MDRQELKKLLGFNYREDAVFGFAKAGFNTTVFDRQIHILEDIRKEMSSKGVFLLSKMELDHLISRLRKAWRAGKKPEEIALTLTESWSLGYGISPFLEPGLVGYLHSVIEVEGNFSPRCMDGFMDSLLRHWSGFGDKTWNDLVKFLVSHREEAEPEIKPAYRYLEPDGPKRLGESLLKRKQSYREATSIMGLTYDCLSYSFFTDTLSTLFGSFPINYGELEEALTRHNRAVLDKTLLPALICRSPRPDKGLLGIATKRIGEPFNKDSWAPFQGASKEQENTLKRARDILSSWITAEVINTFFEVLCNDKKRKQFWSAHAGDVTDFTVYGSKWSKAKAQKRIPGSSVGRRFRELRSSQDNCALALFIGEYVIVEFTDVGALYAYQKDSSNYRAAFRYTYPDKVDELKITSLPMLYDLDSHKFRPEGKLNHSGNWQDRMNKWFKHFVFPGRK